MYPIAAGAMKMPTSTSNLLSTTSCWLRQAAAPRIGITLASLQSIFFGRFRRRPIPIGSPVRSVSVCTLPWYTFKVSSASRASRFGALLSVAESGAASPFAYPERTGQSTRKGQEGAFECATALKQTQRKNKSLRRNHLRTSVYVCF